ncbi:MAG: hypothetical protein QOJ07_769 [Thermoleophilaceae bacterium]|jgi:hypothetical protein|nr:hypothetical protein [Thermoleophilaceae bacterium]
MNDQRVEEAVAAIGRAGGLVTLDELAHMWQVSRQDLRRRVERGELPEPIKKVAGAPVYLLAQVEGLRYLGGRPRGISARFEQVNPRRGPGSAA